MALRGQADAKAHSGAPSLNGRLVDLASLRPLAYRGQRSYNSRVKYPRVSGILLHPTSLPSHFGIGDLGNEAYQLVDFLHGAGQRLWQVLPLGPTGYGDSPYQVFSAFAGNPLLISLEQLAAEGLLSPEDWRSAPPFPAKDVDYGAVIHLKFPVLRLAFERFQLRSSSSLGEAFREFCQSNATWLDDYALFAAIKDAHGGIAWNQWDSSIALRQPAAMAYWNKELFKEIECRKFWQFVFFKQWTVLRRYCHDRQIQIMGDIPIFVARDSADVWAHPELFYLDAQGNPTVVAGVPPDYFSATGQLWGNPLYRWDVMAKCDYRWWVERFRSAFETVHIVRLDHFRGFEAYWEVPAGETTAVRGSWVKGPGARLFEAVRRELGQLPIVAENLGLITPEVEELRKHLGFPGMAILQFAFESELQQSDFLPHNYRRNCLVYTGTHDNDTTVGWWTNQRPGHSTRSEEEVRKEREFALKYLAADGREIHWTFIRAALSSVANLAVIPLQDILGLGSEARMNLPARPTGNWRWRYTSEMLTEAVQNRLKELTRTYGRG
jgi:4-alpha-glucanotransferase